MVVLAEYIEVEAKSVLNKLKRRDAWYGCLYTVNPYRGCEFACSYCYDVAPRWRGRYHSEPWEVHRRIVVKVNAPQVLRRELSKRQRDVVFVGSATDPYQPAESGYRLTRQVLEAFAEARWPVEMGTKSDLVLRDLDLLVELSKHSGVAVYVTITTLDENLAKALEPRAPPPKRRLEIVEALSAAGIETCVTAVPVFPYLTADERGLIELARESKRAGATCILFGALTLEADVRKRLYPVLDRLKPGLSALYDKMYGRSSLPPSDFESRLARLEERVRRDFGFSRLPKFAERGLHRTLA